MKTPKSWRTLKPGKHVVYGAVFIDTRQVKPEDFRRCLRHEVLMLEKDLTAYYKKHYLNETQKKKTN